MNKRSVYGIKTDLIFDLKEFKFKRKKKGRFNLDYEAGVFYEEEFIGYRFSFAFMEKNKIKRLDVYVSEYDLPYADKILEAYASKYGRSVGRDVIALAVSKEIYKKAEEELK